MNSFTMNGIHWSIYYVDPHSSLLVDRTNELRVATTDPKDKCIYLASNLSGDFLNRVLIHELGHCAIFSFNLLDDIHTMVRQEYWMDAEEWICNFIADYGRNIFNISRQFLGDDIIKYIPSEIERLIA